VFDVDDTISIHHNRDYPNAEPIQPVIDKINRLKAEGYYIKLYTARGQNSCHGDIELIKERNEDVLRDWLDRHGVQYDELIFGKPLGDWYIDDKGMSLEAFLAAEFRPMRGGSGSGIWLEGKTVVKKTSKATAEEEWYRRAESYGFGDRIPKLYSRTLDTLFMEYIEGETLADGATKKDIYEALKIPFCFAMIPDGRKDVEGYCRNLMSHKSSEATRWVVSEVMRNRRELEDQASFCHGDLSLSNIIRSKDGLKVIDPNNKADYSSHLLDIAKIRFSLTGYERIFGYGKADLRGLRRKFDEYTQHRKIIPLLEITHWIRLYKYRTAEEQKTVDRVVDELIKEYRKWS